MADEADDSMGELSDVEFLRDLAERLMHVPVAFGVDQGDVDRLISVASTL